MRFSANHSLPFYMRFSFLSQSQSAISPERMLAIQYNNYFLMNETNTTLGAIYMPHYLPLSTYKEEPLAPWAEKHIKICNDDGRKFICFL